MECDGSVFAIVLSVGSVVAVDVEILSPFDWNHDALAVADLLYFHADLSRSLEHIEQLLCVGISHRSVFG